MYRTHKCSQVSEKIVGANIKVAGWVSGIRDHGGVKFIDLRDETGTLQIVAHEGQVNSVTRESSVSVTGILKKRSLEAVNPKILTGEYEVLALEIALLGACEALPFEIQESENVKEELRLKYRFLDLRNPKIHEKILLRSDVIHFLRCNMRELGFFEIQTPLLSASSPEGARDYLVPSRKYKGRFYALPQAPQIFKQLLMVSGFERYFQIAPCFRDEDSRADRAPGEFYQLDFEMAFADQEDVFSIGEQVLSSLFLKFGGKKVTDLPFPRISYAESIEKYGTDKPDLRNPLEICDVSEIFKNSGFKAFDGKIVKAISVSEVALKPRSFFDDMLKFSKEIGMTGLGYIKICENKNLLGPIEKFIPQDRRGKLLETAKSGENSVIFFISDIVKEKACKFACQVRNELAEKLGIIDKEKFAFCYVTDFNMYERDEETNKIVFTHNPFSMPQGGIEALEDMNPLDVLAYQYDIVCNGIELSSGAVRNHDIKIMLKAFEIAGYSKSDVISKFPSLFRAFSYGAPPHAGMAPGLDRILMLLTGSENIREITAFPMNSGAQDILLGAPSEVSEEQLREIHIKIR
ncbi:MAG: aspartate--tRNA ligase [Oscillospiraceae bacterium]|nr:aspartate--tRNA ligase [Oscillospiraceae bacterium]